MDFTFLSKKVAYTEFAVYKRKIFSHNNYVIIGRVDADDSKLTSGEGLLKLLSKGAMRFQINWTDINRNFFIVDEIGKLAKKNVPKILDIGCSKSELLQSLYRHMIRVEYHGMDMNINNLISTIESIGTTQPYYLYHHNCNFGMPFIDNYFDAILFLDVIEHMPTLEEGYELFKNALRTLKLGGLMFLTTPNRDNADEGKELVCASSHKHEYSRQQMLDLFESTGVEIIKEAGSLMSKKKYNEISANDEFARRIYENRVASSVAKLETVSNYYPQHCKESIYILRKQ